MEVWTRASRSVCRIDAWEALRQVVMWTVIISRRRRREMVLERSKRITAPVLPRRGTSL